MTDHVLVTMIIRTMAIAGATWTYAPPTSARDGPLPLNAFLYRSSPSD